MTTDLLLAIITPGALLTVVTVLMALMADALRHRVVPHPQMGANRAATPR